MEKAMKVLECFRSVFLNSCIYLSFINNLRHLLLFHILCATLLCGLCGAGNSVLILKSYKYEMSQQEKTEPNADQLIPATLQF